MALGVIFYGLMKAASKKFIEAPVHLITGIKKEYLKDFTFKNTEYKKRSQHIDNALASKEGKH